MAMMDYGAIAFKNGKLIQTEMFGEMIDMVGWEDTEADVYHNYDTKEDVPIKLKGNYFAYIGDKDATVGFYKCHLFLAERWDYDNKFHVTNEWFNNTDYKWYKWVHMARGLDDGDMIVTKRNGYYVFRWKYKGDKYKVYFGYGVDLYCYKKYRVVNAYRGPVYWLMKLRNKLYYIKKKKE